jgi:hypothetical protein
MENSSQFLPQMASHVLAYFCTYLSKKRSITCKHNARWLHVSQLKASVVYSFQKIYNVNKTCQLKPGKGAGIW